MCALASIIPGHYRIPVWLTSGARSEKLAQLHLLATNTPSGQASSGCASARRCLDPFECALRDLRVNYYVCVPNERRSPCLARQPSSFAAGRVRRVRRREGVRAVQHVSAAVDHFLSHVACINQQHNIPLHTFWTACGRAPHKILFLYFEINKSQGHAWRWTK
jgi:hypothetical protein